MPLPRHVDLEPQCVRQRYHVLCANSVWDGRAVIAPKVVRLSEPTRWPRRQDWGANLRRFLWSMCNEARSAGAQTGGTLSRHFGGDLVGDVDSGIRGVGTAGVDVDKDVVSVRQCAATGPAGGVSVLLSGGGAQCAVRVGYRPHVPQRSRLGMSVLATGRPLLSRGGEEGSCLFGRGKYHHRLLDVVSEIIALLQCLFALGGVTAAGIDLGLRRAVDG